jgi:hypothetical protein
MTLEEMLKNAPNIRESEGMRYIKSIPLQPAQKPVIQENFNPDEFLKSIPMPQVQKGFADKRDMSVKLEPLKSKKKEKKQNLLEQLGSGIEKSYDKYAQNNPDTPNWLKPLGYAVETPYRIPFVNRLLNSASETAVGKEGLADNAVSKQYSQNAGKIGNVIADIAGAGLGMGVNPANQGLNQIGNAAEMFALKQLSKNGVNIATKEGAKLAENILPYLGQAGVKGLRSAAEMGTLGGMQANIEGANANDTTKAALGSAGMGFAFGSGSKVLGDSLTLFNKAKNEIKSTVSEAQKQGLINAYAERFGVPPETMTEAILKDQPLLLTAPSKPMEAPLNVLPGGDTIPMGGKIEGSRPVVRILKNRTETPNPTIEKYGKKFTVKNTLLEKAQQDYDNAIQQIQNATGHYKLTDDEILNAAVKLGIDPFKLIDNIEKSQSGINLDKLGERARLARLAGLNDNIPPLNKTNVNIENKPVFSGYVDQKVENPAPPKTPFQIDIENQATAKRLSALTGRPYEVILKELQSTNSSNNQVLPQYAKENPFDVFSKPAGSKTTQGNANIPLNNSEPLKPSIGATDRTKSTLEVVTSKSENKLNPRTTAENIYTHAIDINQPIKKVGNDTFVYATNSKKIGGTVNYILNDAFLLCPPQEQLSEPFDRFGELLIFHHPQCECHLVSVGYDQSVAFHLFQA